MKIKIGKIVSYLIVIILLIEHIVLLVENKGVWDYTPYYVEAVALIIASIFLAKETR